MKTTIKATLAAILFLAVACKKENNTIHSLSVTDKNSMDVTSEIAAKYSYVKIGNQKWMSKNLDVTHYRNGDKIPQVTDPNAWTSLTTGAWCWYNNDPANGTVYGKLYNWYAVNDPRGLAPSGWYIPSDAEWDSLAAHLGKNAGGKLKDTGTIEAGTGLWLAPNGDATNKTGFTGLPCGYREIDGGFYSIGRNGSWWGSTEDNTSNAWYHNLYYLDGLVYKASYSKRLGIAVRCIKD